MIAIGWAPNAGLFVMGGSEPTPWKGSFGANEGSRLASRVLRPFAEHSPLREERLAKGDIQLTQMLSKYRLLRLS